MSWNASEMWISTSSEYVAEEDVVEQQEQVSAHTEDAVTRGLALSTRRPGLGKD